MPTSKLTQKTVNGLVVTQRQFRDAVFDAVKRFGPCKPRVIAAELGVEWTSSDAGKVIAKMLNTLRRGDFLVQDAEGNYGLAPNFDFRHSMSTEQQILKVVTDLGGICHTADILEAFGCRVIKDPTMDMVINSLSDERKIRREITNSPYLRNYFKAGIWGLQWEKLLAQPLRGCWAKHLLERGFVEATPSKFHTMDKEYISKGTITDWFERVGTACKALRVDLDISPETVVSDSIIREDLSALRFKNPEINNIAYHQARIQAEDIISPTTKGLSKNEIEAKIELQREEETEPDRLNAHLLLAFEEGDRALHTNVPASFYRALAKIFNVCPASLSRGVIMWLPKDLQ